MAQVYTQHPRELVAVKQEVAWQQIRDAYSGAYQGVFEKQVALGPLAILLAHSALETGRWKAGLWNWNLGNIKASESYIQKPGAYHQYYRLNEYLKQADGSFKYVWFDPPHPQTRMRAYKTSADGAAEKVRFLGTASNPAKGNRYQKAWDALEADDPGAYSKELHRAGYYTAQEGPYTRGLVSLYKEYKAKIESEPPTPGKVVSTPLDSSDYDETVPLHSATTDTDLVRLWIGEPSFGLPDDLRAEIARDKQLALQDD